MPSGAGEPADEVTGRVHLVCKGQPEAVLRREQRIGRHGGRTGERAFGISLERVPFAGAPLNCCRPVRRPHPGRRAASRRKRPHVKSGPADDARLQRMAERIAALPAVPTHSRVRRCRVPLITAHFVVGPPRLPAIIDCLTAAAQQAAQSADFKLEMERLLIVGRSDHLQRRAN